MRRVTLLSGVVAGLVVLALGLSACGGSSAESAGGGQKAQKQVMLVTDFGFNGRHSYFYVALDKGYYRDAGLDVKIERGNGSADAIKQVAAGQADVGFADAATLVLARGNEQVPVKLVAVVYQRPAQAIFGLASSGMAKPQDLAGRSVAAPAGSAVKAMFPLYAKKIGIPANSVKWVIADASAAPGLLATGKVDGTEQYTVGRALLEKAVSGKPLVEFAYKDAGLEYYSNGIVTTEKFIQDDPDTVRAFVGATVRGMTYAFAHPREAGEIFHKHHPEIDASVAQAETQAVQDIAVTPETEAKGLGYMDPNIVRETVEAVKSSFDLKYPVQPNDLYVPGFVPKVGG